MFFLVLLYLVLLGLLIYLNYIIAKKFEKIAFDKGYGVDGVHAFAMVFWLGIIGILYVIALPPKSNDNIGEKNT